MPSASDRMRNNIRAGVFVLFALLLTTGVILVLGDVRRFFDSPSAYVVTFPVEDGVKNLSGGSDVRVGGLSMGRVTSIQLVKPDDADAPAKMIEVRFTLTREVRMYSNAEIAVGGSLIGSEAWLDITSLGGTDADPDAILLDDGATIAGARAGTMLSSLLGPDADRVSRILANVDEGTEFFADLENRYEADVLPILGNVEQATGDARDVLADLRQNRWPVWAEQVSRVMTRANELTDNIDKAVANADGLIQDGHDVVAENRDSVHSTITNLDASSVNVREITERVRTETVDKVNTLLSTGQEGIDEAVVVLQAVRTDYDVWSTHLTETLSNATLTSQQLKLAGIEIRRSPWKLLYRPSADELEHELLYEAARSFALAATELKAASLATRRMLDSHEERLKQEPELIRKITENLLDPLEQYERAQTRLFEVLKLQE